LSKYSRSLTRGKAEKERSSQKKKDFLPSGKSVDAMRACRRKRSRTALGESSGKKLLSFYYTQGGVHRITFKMQLNKKKIVPLWNFQ